MGIVNPLLRLHSKKRQSLRNLLSGGILEHSRAASPLPLIADSPTNVRQNFEKGHLCTRFCSPTFLTQHLKSL